MSKLTQKQENFCLAYLETGNASEAYRRAYNCENSKPETINKRASELLDNGDIAGRIAELNKSAVTAAVMTRTEAMEKLSALARTDLKDLVEFGEYELGSDPETGEPIIQSSWRIKPSALQDPVKLAAISELTASKDGIKIKTHSPLAAIKQLTDMQGWNAAQKFDHSSTDGSMSSKIDASKLSMQALSELMAARNESE